MSSLKAFLADLDEQTRLFRMANSDPLSQFIMADLQLKLAGYGVIIALVDRVEFEKSEIKGNG